MVKGGAEADKEADLLCGDTIVNYKTVQSFGHEDAIYEMYEKILLPNLSKSKIFSVKLGFALGLAEAVKFAIMGGLFWIGAEIIEYYGPKEIDVEAVMGSILLLMFSMMNAATAASTAPDLGRANASVDKVFDILDH